MPTISPARIRTLRAKLLAWWDAGHRELPWRFAPGEADAYRVWISEAMLQQTQVAAVVPYYARFLARFPSLRSLATASEDDVVALWSGLGYYARARALHRAAREALARHGGLPSTVEELRELPGFGPYTAAAVASIAFGRAAAAVDGNVARVLARVFLVEDPPEARAFRVRVGALADALVDPSRAGDWNQALMDLGATICVKPTPRCDACPLGGACAARRAGRGRDVPVARARPEKKRVVLACALVRSGGRLLVSRRPERSLFHGTWGPPAVEAATETAARGAMPAVLASMGIRVLASGDLGRVERALTHRRALLVGIGCRLAARPPIGATLRWVSPEAMAQLGTSAAMQRLLESCFGREFALTREGASV
ncbi:MAG TPA: A/G-specific adenine glycosylase [Anaeromyxobacteraceae bacterium]|nr:A/G-specific adenine glycosylase [Anaeromyxobacteraceae bacterium]